MVGDATNGYRIWDEEKGIIKARDVKFEEKIEEENDKQTSKRRNLVDLELEEEPGAEKTDSIQEEEQEEEENNEEENQGTDSSTYEEIEENPQTLNH